MNSDDRLCDACGAQIGESDRFCGECGTELKVRISTSSRRVRWLRGRGVLWVVVGLVVAVGATAGALEWLATGDTGATGEATRAVSSDDTGELAEVEPTGKGTSAEGGYGPPVWLPSRYEVRVGCVKGASDDEFCSNEGKPWHGYWAIDFLAPKGTPVYAAGAGQLFIGPNPSDECFSNTNRTSGTAGNWVWIEHNSSGTDVTRYLHLDAISPDVADGGWVDQNDIIGWVGSSGLNIPCPTDHLHYERRTAWPGGERVYPGELKACHGDRLVSYPDDLGYSAWDDVAFRSGPAHSDHTDCKDTNASVADSSTGPAINLQFVPPDPAWLDPDPLPGSGGATGSGCSPGTEELPDGAWFGDILSKTDIDIRFDLACLYWEPDRDPDFSIENVNPTVREIEVSSETPILAQPEFGEFQEIAFRDWTEPCATRFGFPCPVWIYINDGRVTFISEPYFS